jgi:hypothetical protein
MTDFVDPAKRREWATQKNMTVFSLFSPQHAATEIVLFLEPPLDFEQLFSRAVQLEIVPGLTARFCSVADLIAMKEKVARPQDLADVAELRRLRGRTS